MNTFTQKAIPKKILSVFLTLCILLTLIPLTEYKAGAEGITIGLLDSIPRGGNGWAWDGTDTLKLYGADIGAAEGKYAVSFASNSSIIIDVIGYNKLTLAKDSAGFINGLSNITVTGTGILDIYAPDGGTAFSAPDKKINLNSAYIKSDSTLTLAEAKNISAESCYIEAPNAVLSASDTYSQKKCYLNVKDITAENGAQFNGGYLESYAIHSSESTSFSNCVVKVMGINGEDIQLGNPINLTDSVFITSQYAEKLTITSLVQKTIDSDGDDPSSTSSPEAGWVYCTEAIFNGSAINGSVSPKAVFTITTRLQLLT